MKLMCCCKILFHFLLFYCICDLLDNRFLQKVAAKPKSNFAMSLKNESPVLELLLDTCVNKKWDNNVLLVIENAVDHCTTSKCSFSRNNPINLFQSNANFDSRRGFRETYLSNETQIAKYHKPISCAIIFISNIIEFTKLMLDMKNSIWWRHEAYFIIVNNDCINSCQLAREFLKQAWHFNILSVIYICKNLNDHEEVYTFNPYTEIAPEIWIRVDNNTLDSSWSLFKFSLEPILALSKNDRLACNDLFFDRGKNLHGTNLKVGLRKTYSHHYDSTQAGYKRFTSPGFLIITSVLHYMNATVTVKFSDTHGYVNNDGEPQSSLKDLTSGTVSMLLNIRLCRHYWNFQVHSFHEDSLAITTMKMEISLIEKLGKLSSVFFIYLFIVSLSLTIILKYILKQSISLAALNYMRICLSNSSLTVPKNTVRRILLIMFIMIGFVFNSFMLGYFTTMESGSNRLPVINTYNDLVNSHLTISSVASIKELMRQKNIKNRFETVKDSRECFDRLLKGNNSIACVETRFLTGYYVRESELFHVSEYSLLNRGVSFFIAEDFPVFSKIQSLLLRINEAGFVKLFYAREVFYRHARFSENYTVKAVEIENIYYIFIVLIGSWVLGIIVLCVEVVAFEFNFSTLKLHKWCGLTYLKLTKWLSNDDKNHVKRSNQRLRTLKLKKLKKSV